jgi:RNA polymerase sigma-70 factor (ECF subfamily)
MVRDQEADDEPQVDFPAADDTHENLAASDRREFVEKALQSLPPSQRVPLVLHHFEGLQYDEIAEKLGVSLGKVKTDIFRGREALRRKLQFKLMEAEESGQACQPI